VFERADDEGLTANAHKLNTAKPATTPSTRGPTLLHCPARPVVSAAVTEGELLWEPSERFKQESRLADYMAWLAERHSLGFETYADLWQWSIQDLERFWDTIVEFFDVRLTTPPEAILPERTMPGARWFVGAKLNYAASVFQQAAADRPALVYQSESRPMGHISWAELERQVAAVADRLRSMGVRRGDRVVAYVPNITETVVAFLAAASVGAVWSSCSPDFGVDAVLDRFAQIEPKVLFAVDGYTYGGKPFSRLDVVRELQRRLPTLEHTVVVRYLNVSDPPETERTSDWGSLIANSNPPPLEFEAVPFEHPLWVLYSSGTTGLPKALVHSHGGVVIEHVKLIALHNNIRAGDRLFWYTSTGWMMWNYIVGGLLLGATPVLFDGNPAYPNLNTLWKLAQEARVKLFGASAAYLMNCLRAGLRPGDDFDLSALECIGSTGSPLPPDGFAWAYDAVKRDLWLASVSGGTDVVSAFLVG
jgi:acetoacetyl-CoA synthetase